MMTTRSLTIRPATQADAATVWRIIEGEKQIMRDAGRDQWQNEYPNPESIAADVAAGVGRVLLAGGVIVGYCALIATGESHYDHIEGMWLTAGDSSHCNYAVVHRIAIAPQLTGQGLATSFMQLLLDEAAAMGLESMRIDTNHDNVQMLHLLPKLGFNYCGIVEVADGPRRAYEKLLR